LNLAQRVVLVVAWGALLRVIGAFIVAPRTRGGGGWFGYAPETRNVSRRAA